ncbi:hydroxyacid dehydrogenase [Leptospira gomenensis]|uniref:Hydroxyacid dehydrogenase n=1 Tax=Leptospira gomenensis TaxID=2484974 RepID=A0A5F1Y9I2_9LEPT|nr:hydroxyacid dehydrogenase [Leptospira gomenensis]TGK45424.1 hydroxyacid dehydrogenase [Leptospira gomenensis]TGK66293.1 hydroxyacid dehydrogenase [Leptospira gomenensis]
MVVKVLSPSFSNHIVLEKKLKELYPDSVFNKEGRRFDEDGVIEFLKDADAAIVGLEKISRRVIDSLPNIRIYAKYGVGLDNIDTEYANFLNKPIGWTPGVNRRSVSELALSYLLALSRNVFFTSYLLKSGSWKKEGGVLLSGKTVGIVGCGHIGEDLLRLLQPFHCKLLVHDILDKKLVCESYGATQVSIENLLNESDFVSLHLPLTERTLYMVDFKFLSQMKPSSYLLNTSRGNIVKESDIKRALENDVIAGAALDVFEEEPPTDLEFLSLKNLIVTPHIGGNAKEAVEAMGTAAIKSIAEYFERP